MNDAPELIGEVERLRELVYAADKLAFAALIYLGSVNKNPGSRKTELRLEGLAEKTGKYRALRAREEV